MSSSVLLSVAAIECMISCESGAVLIYQSVKTYPASAFTSNGRNHISDNACELILSLYSPGYLSQMLFVTVDGTSLQPLAISDVGISH